MSRHGGRAGRRMPVFQIEVGDCSNSDYFKWILFEKGEKGKVGSISPPESLQKCRTLFGRFKNSEAAKRWGSRFGAVKACFKVDVSPWFKKVEHIDLNKPISVVIERDEYVLNQALELSRPTIDYENKKIDVEVVDKENGL